MASDPMDIGLSSEKIKNVADIIEFWAEQLNKVDPMADELPDLWGSVEFLREQQAHKERKESARDLRMVTDTGCTVRLLPVPTHWEDQSSGLLRLAMEQSGDGRTVEVILTQAEMLTLGQILERGRDLTERWAKERGENG